MCQACGLPSTEDFCTRPACLTYGGGACARGPAIVNRALIARVAADVRNRRR